MKWIINLLEWWFFTKRQRKYMNYNIDWKKFDKENK
jgi:hypothetical protein